MPGPFFERLRDYYLKVAAVLRGEAQAAAIFPNSSDIGVARERIYAEFLRQHAPSKCNVFLGGFVFGEEGDESSQLDVIVTTDTTPNFNFHNLDGSGKSFSPVEGTLGVVSIKSTLDKKALEDALAGIASVPLTSSLEGRVSFALQIQEYEDWPYKVIYASDGIKGETLLTHINDYYLRNSSIPVYRRPNLIHVAGKYIIARVIIGMSLWDANKNVREELEIGSFRLLTKDPDIQGIVWVLDGLQQRATASAHILYNYGDLINKISRIPVPKK